MLGSIAVSQESERRCFSLEVTLPLKDRPLRVRTQFQPFCKSELKHKILIDAEREFIVDEN